MRSPVQPITPVQLQGPSAWEGPWHKGGCAFAKYELDRTVVTHAVQSSWLRLEELPVQTRAGALHAFVHADMLGYGPCERKARLHWPFAASQ
jgi:hypothetical protein